MLAFVSPPDDAVELAPGTPVGRYVVEARVGAGAHAVVYRAHDARDGALVALKVLGAGHSSAAEQAALARVRGDRVVAFRGLERVGDRSALVFAWMPGGSLAEDLARGPWSAARVETLARDLLAGLSAAHEAGVLHRDLKPSNVLLDADGRARLGDFGIAARGDDASSPTAGRIEGSPAYLAPEVVRSEPATERSDLWGLGVLLFRALYGRLPFEGRTDVETFVAILKHRPARPARVAGLSPGLADLIDRCLRKGPEHRPSSCAEALLVLDGGAPPAPYDDDDRPLGREAELSELDAWTGSIDDVSPTFVILRGGEGVGLSTLLAAAGERARARGVAWIPVSIGGESFLRSAQRAALRAFALGQRERSPEVAAAIGRMEATEGSESGAEAPAELVHDLEIVLRGAAGAAPVVLAIDEVHCADPSDLRRIDDVVRAITRARGSAIVAVRRPADGSVPLARLGTDLRARTIDVSPLSGAAVVAVLERDAGGRLDFEVASTVVERAAGDVRHARALLAHLRASGALEDRGGVTAGRPGWLGVAVLPTEAERVRAVLEGLSDPARALVEAAAVDGLEVEPATLARVLARDERDVVADLGRLSDPIAGLFAGSGAAIGFTSAATRDTVLETLSAERRRELHRAFVTHLESRATLEPPDRIGLHLEGAGEPARARAFLVRAARAAMGRFELRSVIELARRAGITAAGVLAPVTPDVVECARVVALSLASLRRHDESDALFRALDDWGREAGDDEIRHRVAVERLLEMFHQRNPTADEVEQLRRAVAGVRDAGAVTKGHRLLGRLAHDDLRFDEAEREYREAIRVAQAAGRPGLVSSAWDRLGSLYFETDRPDEGAAALEEAIAIQEARGNRGNAAISRFKLAWHRFDAERPPADARAFLAEIDEIRQIGADHAAAMARGEFARILRTEGELEGARVHGELAVADLTRLRVDSSIGPARCDHAATRLAVGDVDGAEAELRVALEISATDAATGEDRRRVAAFEALVALTAGHVERALRALERAVYSDGAAPGLERGTIPVVAEALLVAAPADAARALAALGERWRPAIASPLVVVRALPAAIRRILGAATTRDDDDAVAAALDSTFVREHHLVAHVAALWAESRRLSLAGDAEGAAAASAAARERARAAGHVGLGDALDAEASRGGGAHR